MPNRNAITIAVSLCITAIMISPVLADRGVIPLGKPLSNSSLAEQRGGHETHVVTDQVFNDMRVNGKVTGNDAINNVTGNNTITNAFTGASGVPTVVQNSGNNVLIQNATIINLELH